MALNQEEFERVRVHLRERWGNVACPMCRTQQWSVHGMASLHLTNTSGDPEADTVGNVAVIPCASVSCMSCGYTVLLNLMFVDGVLIPRAPTRG